MLFNFSTFEWVIIGVSLVFIFGLASFVFLYRRYLKSLPSLNGKNSARTFFRTLMQGETFSLSPSLFASSVAVRSSLLVLIVLFLLVPFVNTYGSSAAGPNQLSFQGKLVAQADGTNVSDGSYAFVFSIYTEETGGTALWTENRTLTVENGFFSANLGAVTPLDSSIFTNDNLWLQVKVGGETLSPRQRLSTNPFTFNASTLEGYSKTGLDVEYLNTAGTGTISIPTGPDTTLDVSGQKLSENIYLETPSESNPLPPMIFGEHIAINGTKISSPSFSFSDPDAVIPASSVVDLYVDSGNLQLNKSADWTDPVAWNIDMPIKADIIGFGTLGSLATQPHITGSATQLTMAMEDGAFVIDDAGSVTINLSGSGQMHVSGILDVGDDVVARGLHINEDDLISFGFDNDWATIYLADSTDVLHIGANSDGADSILIDTPVLNINGLANVGDATAVGSNTDHLAVETGISIEGDGISDAAAPKLNLNRTVAGAGVLGQILFKTYDGTGTDLETAGAIELSADGLHSEDNVPSRLVFYTTPSSANTMVERLRIDKNGNVGIGDFSADGMDGVGAKFHVAGGGVCVTAVATTTCDNVTAGDVLATGTVAGGGVDLAERFATSGSPKAGDIVMVDTSAPERLKKAVASHAELMVGVVSTKPGLLLTQGAADAKTPIALAGRVPVNVNMSGGAIAIGDFIGASDVAGQGKKVSASEAHIGIALQSSNSLGQVVVLLSHNRGTSSGDTASFQSSLQSLIDENTSLKGRVTTIESQVKALQDKVGN